MISLDAFFRVDTYIASFNLRKLARFELYEYTKWIIHCCSLSINVSIAAIGGKDFIRSYHSSKKICILRLVPLKCPYYFFVHRINSSCIKINCHVNIVHVYNFIYMSSSTYTEIRDEKQFQITWCKSSFKRPLT